MLIKGVLNAEKVYIGFQHFLQLINKNVEAED